MKKAVLAVGGLTFLFVFVVLAIYRQEPEPDWEPLTVTAADIPAATPGSAPEAHRGFLYGRVVSVDGPSYEGRLRFGGGEEAFWGDYFNGYKDDNPWAAKAPPEELKESNPIELFGMRIAKRETRINLGRPFMARFGDIARLEARGSDLQVTLRNGSVFDLDRYNADDFADGLRVWDAEHGVVDLHERSIASIEFLPTADLGDVPDRLYGTVRTNQGEFTGFVQWNRRKSVGTDELEGGSSEGDVSLRFDAIRSIARESHDSSRTTLHDGHEIVLSGTRAAGHGNLGAYVDDPRYGRVLIRWSAFERVDFSAAGSGPAFDDFPPGSPLTGSVITRDGSRLSGRLVYDLDESETTETLDAPFRGVTYTVPFGLISSITFSGREESGVPLASVSLHSGEALQLESRGDLGGMNAGMLIFVDGHDRAEYVRWPDVERIELDRPPAMYPPLDP